MNSMMNAPIELVREFYENYGFSEEVREDNGDINMMSNCSFKARAFTGENGGEATEPFWRDTENGKQYCFVLGTGKVKGLPNISAEEKLCILNKVSYDAGDFELGKLYSSVCNVPMTDAEGKRHPKFNDIYFTVFENIATNNDMGDLVSNEFEAFMAKKGSSEE